MGEDGFDALASLVVQEDAEEGAGFEGAFVGFSGDAVALGVFVEDEERFLF